MKTLSAILLSTVLLPAGVLGQTMGGPLSTSPYFPMVDGARHDYLHTGGAWASSTVVMRGGQAWAGRSGLYAMHSTYTCVVGATCAPAGVRFSMMSLTDPEWALRNPAFPGTMMGGGGYANAGSWTTSVKGTGSMMGPQSYMSTYFVQGLETVITPAGTFANALHVREQRGSGAVRDV